MAHEWVDITRELPIAKQLSVYGARRCVKCGAEQEKIANYSWGRVMNYQWYPLVGRCKGDRNAKTK